LENFHPADGSEKGNANERRRGRWLDWNRAA
jgi:hypothetical protein